MKKLLLISSLFPSPKHPNRGIFVRKQIQQLARHYKIYVLATHSKTSPKHDSTILDNIPIYYIDYNFPLTILAAPWYYAAISKKLKNILAEFEPQTILIHDYRSYPEIFILSRLLDFSKYKVVLNLHNDKLLADKSLIFSPLYIAMAKSALPRFHKIIVVSPKVENILKSAVPNLASICVIGNGIENNFHHLPKTEISHLLPTNPSSFNILSVGNLVQTKGFDLLIKSIENLQPQYDLSLTIVGDGPCKKNLLNLAAASPVSQKISFFGSIDHELVMNLYKYYDAFVLPSYSETFGIVYLEAMYNGLPVIGIKDEGIDGVITDNINGFLALPRSQKSLDHKISQLISHPEINSIKQNAQNTVKNNYLLSSIINKLLPILNP